MSKIIIVEATLDIAALNPCMEECWWQLKVRTAKNFYDSRGQRLRSVTRCVDDGSVMLTHSAFACACAACTRSATCACAAHPGNAAHHAAQIALRVCDLLEQMGEDAAMRHYVGATRAQLWDTLHYSRIAHVFFARRLDELLTTACAHVDAARTAELEYLQAAEEALAECLVRRGIPQSCAKGWLHEDGVFYPSGLHYSSDARFPIRARVVFKNYRS